MATALFEWFVGLSWAFYKLSEAGVRLSLRRLQQRVDRSTETVVMDPDVGKIAKNLVKSVATGEISALKPQLDAINVRLIGVGLEELGLDDFLKGEFFTGDLFLDVKKQCYKDLGFRRLNFFSLFPAIMAKVSRDAMDKAKKEKIDGNLKGDGMQNGGILIVETGGKLLLSFKQENPADHLENREILKAVGNKNEEKPEPPPTEEGAKGIGVFHLYLYQGLIALIME
ncbi:Prostamide/prostaglandin F synthase [Mizuhopecten yessoensis]|uniref:Prostamide/prostaglandin F synthase n=1 Tax=Mizuhopecten yessoensis TaxID=6573 RepID=A0A210Q2Y2_MIZYE|nr:Prostamide/prostaglandin F synthase [Mizuhopecten yessoensis]